MKKLLFVCMGNLNRSPTFERWFKKNRPQYEVKSTGTAYNPTGIQRGILFTWADKIFVMDLSQEMYIAQYYPKHISKVEVIGISDQYDPDEHELILLVQYWAMTRGL